MHIVTGMLLAGFMGKRRGLSLLPMLRSGPVQTAHSIPGRVRFRIPSLAEQPERAAELEARLATLEGVVDVRAASRTGSLLIRYREEKVRPELLFAATVRLMGLEDELQRCPPPAVVRELRSVVDSLNRVIYDRTGGLLNFTSALMILLAGLGVRKLFQQGASGLPSGFTLIWWGVHQLLGHGDVE
jgi:hypothetical protein